MGKIAELWINIGAKLDNFNKGMSQMEKATRTIGKKLSKVGKQLTMKVTLPIIALGVAAVKMGADFEQSITNAFAVTGAESEEVKKKMEALARTMGEVTVFSAREAADAMYWMASAGWKVEEMTDALEPTLALAAATQSDLAFTTEAVITTLNQFGLQASDATRVSNVFAAAIGNSQATLERLKESMKYIGPMADAMGWSIEDTTAILMEFYEIGIDASMAGTALRMAFSQLAAGTPKTQKALKELGLTMADVNPETKSLGEIIEVLSGKTMSLSQAIAIFGVRAGPPMLAVLKEGTKAFTDFKDKITGTQAASEMARKQLDTFKGSTKLLTSALTESAIQISKILIPVFRNLIDNHIKPAVLWFNNLSEGTKKTIVKFAGLAAAAGPFLLVLGKIIQILPYLSKAFLAFSKVLKGVAFNLVAVILIFKSFERYFPLVGKALEDVKNKAKALDKELGRLVGWEEFHRAVFKAGLATGEFAAMIRDGGHDVEKFLSIMTKRGSKHAADYIAIYTGLTRTKEEFHKRDKKLAEDLRKIEQWAIDDIKAHRVAMKAKGTAYYALKGNVDGYIRSMEERIRIEETDADVIDERIAKLKETITAEGLLYDAFSEVNEALKKSKSLTLEERDQLELTKEAIERKIEALLDAGKAQKTLGEKIKFTVTAEMELSRQFGEGKISIIEYTAGMQKLREEAERIKDPFKNVELAINDIQLVTDEMVSSFIVLGSILPPIFIEQMSLGQRWAKEAGETAKKITISFKSMAEHFIDFVMNMGDAFGNFVFGVLDKGSTLAENLKGLWIDIGNSFKAMVADFIADEMKKLFLSILKGATKAGESIVSNIGGALKGVAEGAKSAVSALNIVGSVVTGVVSGLVSGLLTGKAPSMEYTNKLLEGISWTQLAAALDKMDETNFFLSEMFPKFDYGNKQLAFIVGITGKIRDGVNGVIKAIKTISGAQHGAIVTQPQLIMAGEAGPEAIVPLNKSSAIQDLGGRTQLASATPTTVIVEIEPVVIPKNDEYVIEFLQKKIRHGNFRIPIEAIGG